MQDRRATGTSDRRMPWRTNRRVVESVPSGNAPAAESCVTRIQTMEVVDSNRQNLKSEREEMVQSREGNVSVRENAAHGRETTVLLREESAAVREHAINEAMSWNAAQQDHSVKLRQANEQLVIASMQAQIMADKIENSRVELVHLANHDFLTGLPNRMALFDRITQAISLAKRRAVKLAVLFLDLDRFKVVNDTLGHAIGDQLLQAVAQRLKSAIRDADTVSRQGGDEFILVLTEVNELAALVNNVEKIHEIISAPYSIAGHKLVIGATIGISIFPENGEDADVLIRNADTAMYYAKENGRDQYQFFLKELRTRDVGRHNLEADMYQALDKQQFVLFYQAQIDLESGGVKGIEALIRWSHPERGLLLPGLFISVAEECGAIVPIGRWVLREACRQAQTWLHAGLVFNVIAVNVSASEFGNADFSENVRAVLHETGLAPERLELELTETVLMKDLECTALTLDALRSLGVRISLDDFGTGYSSLSYLKRLPVDTMKIDQLFVHDISNGDDDILINAVIGLGKSLRHHVIAEGVETAKQLAFLRKSGCPAVQGFYLNAPMSAAEFGAFLKQGVAPDILGD